MGFFGKLFDKPPTREEFVPIAQAAMEAAGWSNVTYDANLFTLTAADGQSCGLQNVYAKYIETDKKQRIVFLSA